MPASPAHFTLPQLGESVPCQVMGILNITPDSFSDGGLWQDPQRAVDHAHDMMAQGAHIIDVGGESTRPGAQRVSSEEETARVVPVVRQLHVAGIPVSVDTMRAAVAAAALEAGADVINDVSGGEADPLMRPLLAEAGVPYCIMHWRSDRFGDAAGSHHDGENIVATVATELRQLVVKACEAGIGEHQIVLDPGVGFAKTRDQDWELLHGLAHIVSIGYPVLLGASRKRFLGEVLGDALPSQSGVAPEAEQRDGATAVVSALAAMSGVWAVRVHDVRRTVEALAVERAWQEGANPFRGREVLRER